jgi:hypothetical protein
MCQSLFEPYLVADRLFRLEFGVAHDVEAPPGWIVTGKLNQRHLEIGIDIQVFVIGNLEKMPIREMNHTLIGNRVGDAKPRTDLT